MHLYLHVLLVLDRGNNIYHNNKYCIKFYQLSFPIFYEYHYVPFDIVDAIGLKRFDRVLDRATQAVDAQIKLGGLIISRHFRRKVFVMEL